MRKVAKLKVEADSLGINLNIDGASEGILIEYEIVPKVFKAVLAEILDQQKADQGEERWGAMGSDEA